MISVCTIALPVTYTLHVKIPFMSIRMDLSPFLLNAVRYLESQRRNKKKELKCCSCLALLITKYERNLLVFRWNCCDRVPIYWIFTLISPVIMSKEVPSYTIWWLNKNIIDNGTKRMIFLNKLNANFLIHGNDKDNNSILIMQKQWQPLLFWINFQFSWLRWLKNPFGCMDECAL